MALFGTFGSFLLLICEILLTNGLIPRNKFRAAKSSSFHPTIPISFGPQGLLLGGNRDARVVLEAALDLNCKYSKEVWPVLKELSKVYASQDLGVIIHVMSLPYHSHAFKCAQGYYTVEAMALPSREDFINIVYDNLDYFNNANDKTDTDVIEYLGSITERATGIPQKEFTTNMTHFRSITQHKWKYIVKRGVAGTPWYIINGVMADPGDATLFQWRSIIDYLLAKDKPQKHSDIYKKGFKPITDINTTKQRISTADSIVQAIRIAKGTMNLKMS